METRTLIVEFKIEQKLYDAFIERILDSTIFCSDYCSWALPELSSGEGSERMWLIREEDVEGNIGKAREIFEQGPSLRAWNQAKKKYTGLVGYYLLDVEVAESILRTGLRVYGQEFANGFERTQVDMAVQLTLLGREVYR